MIKKSIIFSVVLFAMIGSFIYGSTTQEKIDYVPDEETAIKVAEAIWYPIYGEKIYKEKPFVARLKNPKVWIVEGTLDKKSAG